MYWSGLEGEHGVVGIEGGERSAVSVEGLVVVLDELLLERVSGCDNGVVEGDSYSRQLRSLRTCQSWIPLSREQRKNSRRDCEEGLPDMMKDVIN